MKGERHGGHGHKQRKKACEVMFPAAFPVVDLCLLALAFFL
jgi:hypothetical protein